jgi:hypothetical protein
VRSNWPFQGLLSASSPTGGSTHWCISFSPSLFFLVSALRSVWLTVGGPIATPSAGFLQENVRYDLGRGTEQMTYGLVIWLVTRWELARPTPHSTWGLEWILVFTWCEAVVVAAR